MPAVRATITLITAGSTVTVVRPVALVTLDPLARNPVLADGSRALDQFSRTVQFQRAPSEQAVALEFVVRGFGKTAADTSRALDAAARSIGKPAQDAAATSDTLTRTVQFQRAPGDVAQTSDAARRATTKALSDTAGLTDDLNGALGADDDQTMVFAKTVSDSGRLADAINSKLISKPASDGSAAGDQALKAFGRPVADSASMTDAINTRDVGKGLSETPRASDALGRTVQFVRGLPQVYVESGYFAEKYHETEEAIFSDAARRTAGKVVTDTPRATDAESFALGKPVADTARATDAEVLGVSKPLSPLYVYHGYFAERYTDIDTDVFTVSDSDVISLSKPISRTARATDAGAVFKQDYVGSSTYFAEFYTGTGSTW